MELPAGLLGHDEVRPGHRRFHAAGESFQARGVLAADPGADVPGVDLVRAGEQREVGGNGRGLAGLRRVQCVRRQLPFQVDVVRHLGAEGRAPQVQPLGADPWRGHQHRRLLGPERVPAGGPGQHHRRGRVEQRAQRADPFRVDRPGDQAGAGQPGLADRARDHLGRRRVGRHRVEVQAQGGPAGEGERGGGEVLGGAVVHIGQEVPGPDRGRQPVRAGRFPARVGQRAQQPGEPRVGAVVTEQMPDHPVRNS